MNSEKEIKKSFTFFSENTQKEILERINIPQNILIMSHKNPDGDAVGSSLGLAGVLKNIGHNVKVYLPDEAPDFLKWLPGYDKTGIFEKSPKRFPGFSEEPGMIFFLDFNSPDRLGKMEGPAQDLKSFKFLIDHHPGHRSFYDCAIVNTSKGSTCELIFLFLEETGLLDRMDKESATCLYTGIITDTLGLQVSSTYSEVYGVVGRLVDYGASIEEVYNKVYNQFSVNRMKLLGYCLAEKMKILPEHRTAYIWLTKEEMLRFNHVKGDTEGFVNYPLSIKDIDFTVLFTEIDGEIKLSLRSKGKVPVNKFAAMFFDGGGHHNASGGRCKLTMEETLLKFENHIKDFMPGFLV